MVYTTYLAKLSALPKDAYKIIIARYIPKSLDMAKIPLTYHYPKLAPEECTLCQYKKGEYTFEQLANRYRRQMEYDEPTYQTIKNLANFIQSHPEHDLFLICYEKNYDICHRSLLATWLTKKYHIECSEWEEKENGNI